MEMVCSQTWSHVLVCKKLTDRPLEVWVSSKQPVSFVYLKANVSAR